MENKTFRQLLLIINFTFAKIKIAKSGFFTYSQNINNANISQYTVLLNKHGIDEMRYSFYGLRFDLKNREAVTIYSQCDVYIM